MMTTNDILQNSDNDRTSASNAIDQMISMSILNQEESNNQNSDQTNNTRSWSPRFVFHIK
jgi:hypothetical protein